MMKSLINQKINIIKDLLNKRLYFEILMKLCDRYISHKLVLLGKSTLFTFHGDRIDILRISKTCIVRKAKPEDLQQIILCDERPNSNLRKVLFGNYFDIGNDCFVLEHGHEIVGFCWSFSDFYIMTFDDYNKSHIKFILQNDTAFLGDAYIKPRYRHRGLYSLLIGMIIEVNNKEHNISRLLVNVGIFNKYSIKVHLRLGFIPIKTLYYVSIFGFEYLISVDLDEKRFFHNLRKNKGIPI